MGQQGLLPRHADPKLWVMETRSGEEREAVVKLMQKAVTMAAAGTPLAITSVFAQDHLRVRAGCCVQDAPQDEMSTCWKHAFNLKIPYAARYCATCSCQCAATPAEVPGSTSRWPYVYI